MATMLNIYDLNRKKTAVLQNAFSIKETQELNKIYSLEFSIPADDPKTAFIQPFHYVRWGEDGELYRIIRTSLDDGDAAVLTVSCEHVIATLVDELLFGITQYGGGAIKTSSVITYLLNKQKTKNWTLGECDFSRKFEYLWEQENILNALYSIPSEFTTAYKWVFNTQVYPWKVSLKTIDATAIPQYYIRAKRNLLSSGTSQEYTNICTRIYPLGYGEGVNQLTIKDVNNGLAYLQSPAGVVAQYGIREKVLVDRRFENAESLMQFGQTMLEALQVPTMSKSFNVIDLYPLTGDSIDNAAVGNICRMTADNTTAYITKTVRVLDEPGNLQIELSTKATDVASTVADLADRVRIETVYAQGATQIYQHSKDENATKDKGMKLSLYFPSEMRQINKVMLKLKLGKFRSYSQATDGAGDVATTTESGGGTSTTTEAGGGTSTTTESGGGTTSSGGGTSVTVSGGAIENQKTVSKSVSLNYSAEVVSSAPQETRTSSPSTDVTTGTAWDGDKSVQTEFTNNGAIQIDLGNQDGELIGETYENYYANDGYHTHDYWGDTGEKAIDGGYHHHKVFVNIPSKTLSVINNDPNTSYYNGQMHRHNLTLNGLAHSHNIEHYHTVNISGTASGGSHTHTFSIPEHSHTISAHSHSITIPSHTHSISIPNHTHSITIPSHTHSITAGIFESGNATAFDVYVGGTYRTTVKATSYDADITAWLLDSKTKRIPRNSWIEVEFRPNDLAYIQSSVFVQGFVQSRGDQTV